jgi:hypothetical protein
MMMAFRADPVPKAILIDEFVLGGPFDQIWGDGWWWVESSGVGSESGEGAEVSEPLNALGSTPSESARCPNVFLSDLSLPCGACRSLCYT